MVKVKDSLEKGESIVFDNLGELSKDEKGGISFNQVNEQELASSTYGLKTLPLNEKVLVDVAAQNVKRSGKRDLSLLYGVVAAVVIVGLFLSVALIFFSDSIFLTDPAPETFNAKTNTKVEQENKVAAEEKDDAASITNVSENSIDEDPVAKSVTTKNDKKQALFYEETESTPHKNFYIISGSYGSLENAEKHYNQLLKKGFRPEIIQGNGRYRIAMVKFSDRNIALRELERIRLQNPNSSFWLLGI